MLPKQHQVDTDDGLRRATFESLVLTKLEHIEKELTMRNTVGSAFEQVTRERVDSIKWTAVFVSGLTSLGVGIVAALVGAFSKK